MSPPDDSFVMIVVVERRFRRFKEHNEQVKQTVPPERLLVFSVKEGWGPLCKFLRVPVPDEPFPHENDREAFKSLHRTFDRGGNIMIAVGVAIVGIASVFAARYFSRA